ncbi:hypothetical protein I3843_08G017400 [Carya illinoinensis]|uniref:Uncharacterized protein n=1 Tax=Carya illinoinensis TaxID=32201 RepID=A0A922E882_CARIL|nr:hypothetical protein I3842_08G016800 [Carya illinoinensis]KAG7965785.1 hypothetical protein I3843_08G017400 [Carya illinoinensis]
MRCSSFVVAGLSPYLFNVAWPQSSAPIPETCLAAEVQGQGLSLPCVLGACWPIRVSDNPSFNPMTSVCFPAASSPGLIGPAWSGRSLVLWPWVCSGPVGRARLA